MKKDLKSNISNIKKPKAEYKWVDKVSLNLLPDIPLENKVTAEDLNYLNNQIKSSDDFDIVNLNEIKDKLNDLEIISYCIDYTVSSNPKILSKNADTISFTYIYNNQAILSTASFSNANIYGPKFLLKKYQKTL